jgi:hypothetical protein
MKEEWVLSIRDQCQDAGVPFFFKQWGGTRKKLAGRRLEGRFYDEFPPVLSSGDPDESRRLARIAQLEARSLLFG